MQIQANPLAVAAIRFLLLTGWREKEALTLRWAKLNANRDRKFNRGRASMAPRLTPRHGPARGPGPANAGSWPVGPRRHPQAAPRQRVARMRRCVRI